MILCSVPPRVVSSLYAYDSVSYQSNPCTTGESESRITDVQNHYLKYIQCCPILILMTWQSVEVEQRVRQTLPQSIVILLQRITIIRRGQASTENKVQNFHTGGWTKAWFLQSGKRIWSISCTSDTCEKGKQLWDMPSQFLAKSSRNDW